MRRLCGPLLMATGVLDLIYVAAFHFRQLAAIAGDGFFGAVELDPSQLDRETAFWHLAFGAMVVILGGLVHWAQSRTGTLPAFLGWSLLALDEKRRKAGIETARLAIPSEGETTVTNADEPARRPRSPVARSHLVRGLRELGVGPGDAVMVHCRMSALGHVAGGAETVVRALFDATAPGGTLMAYTGWQDEPPEDLDALGEEARRIYLEEHPPYDPRTSLARRDHGRIPETLRTWPGSLHSGHPEAGVAAIGPLAGMLTAEHPHDDAYGFGTPYARLVEAGERWRWWGRRSTP